MKSILIALALSVAASTASAQALPIVVNEPQGSLTICMATQGVGSIVRIVC